VLPFVCVFTTASHTLTFARALPVTAGAPGARKGQLDFATVFDQFQLTERAMPWFVLRAREEDDGERLFALTRMPMGACFAPSAAQAVTSALVEPPLKLDGVGVDTIIDTVRISWQGPRRRS